MDLPPSPNANPNPTPSSISAVIDQAALGQNIFTPATLHLLERRSFELAAAQENPRKIAAVFGLVLKSRDNATRERMAEIQKQKLALRLLDLPQPSAADSIR